jgi:dTDP-glucose 4,6-dehydratase
MNQLASEIISLVGSKSNISFKPLPGDDPKDREPDISRAEDLLGWKPKVNRSLGLQNTIEYFKSCTLL